MRPGIRREVDGEIQGARRCVAPARKRRQRAIRPPARKKEPASFREEPCRSPSHRETRDLRASACRKEGRAFPATSGVGRLRSLAETPWRRLLARRRPDQQHAHARRPGPAGDLGLHVVGWAPPQPTGADAPGGNAWRTQKGLGETPKPFLCDGRSGGIRTHDPLTPSQVRYQAALRSDRRRAYRGAPPPQQR